MSYIIYAIFSASPQAAPNEVNCSDIIVTLDKEYATGLLNVVTQQFNVPAYVYKAIEHYTNINDMVYVPSDVRLIDPYSGNPLGSFKDKLKICIERNIAWFELDFILKKFGVTPRIYAICLELSKLSGDIDTPLCVSRDAQCKDLWYWLVSPGAKLNGAWRDIMYNFNRMFEVDVKLRNRYEFNMFIEAIKKLYFV
mgnify:CR=1 FL=1